VTDPTNHLMLAQMAGPDGPSPFGPIVMMMVIFGIFYVLMIRPQQKRERDKDSFRSNLKRNDDVVTVGGIFGRVVDLKGPIIWLEIAPNVRVRVERRSIEAPVGKPGKSDEGKTAKGEEASS
jgi:preprotein translocase subunit YajC